MATMTEDVETTTELPHRVDDTAPLQLIVDDRTLSGPGRTARWRQAVSSLRTRVLLWYVLLLAVALVLAILVVRQLLYLKAEERIEQGLTQEVEEMRRLARGNDPETGRPFGGNVERIFDVYRSRNVPFEHEVVLTFVDGELYGSTRPPLVFDEATVARWSQVTTGTRGQVATADGQVDYLAIPLTADGTRAGVWVAAIFSDFERAEISGVIRILTLVAFVTVVFASVLAWAAAGRALEPVRLVIDTARRISDDNLAARIPVKGRDEISQLAATFNNMLDRLEAAFASQRHFIDDAGHELRTPITIIRGHLELLGDDPQERRDTIRLVIDELDRMHRIVNDLLLLAKAKQPDFLRLDVADLGVLTNEIYAKAAALAARDWRLESRGTGTVVVDEQRLTQAMLQLADNATRHTEDGDAITIGSCLDGHVAHLWVHDTGTGIPAEEQDRIFDRFARAGGPRRSEGAGLGLAIVRAIAEAHDGTVSVRSNASAGTTFTLALPIGASIDEPGGDVT